jgi:DNA polymerase eta
MQVIQYNPYEKGGVTSHTAQEDRKCNSNGSIIAVSYEARAKGVTRQMRGAEAKKKCPDLILVQVPTAFGKADLAMYKKAGDGMLPVFCCQPSAISPLSARISTLSTSL